MHLKWSQVIPGAPEENPPFVSTPSFTPIMHFESTLKDVHHILSNLLSHLKVSYKTISSSKIHTQQTSFFFTGRYDLHSYFLKGEYF